MTKKTEQAELLPVEREQVAALPEKVAAQDTPLDLLRMAVSQNADVDKLEKLMDLQKRWQDEKARKAYFAAMNRVQAAIQPIARDAENKFTKSRYARPETIHAALCPIYTKEGFSIAFGEEESPTQGMIRVTAKVMHAEGHMEPYRVDLAPDDKGAQGNTNKTPVQAKGSTFQYGRRYLEKMIFNIAEVEEDDDGTAGAVNTITQEEAATLRELCEAAGRNPEKLCEAVGCKSLDAFPAAAYPHWQKTLKDMADKAQRK